MLVLIEIKEKLFDSGLMEDFAEYYYTSGIIMGLSVLQNGKIPTLSEEQLQELIDDSSEHSPCILNLRNALRKVGVLQLIAKLPLCLYLFRPSDSSTLSVRNLVRLLEPKFAEEGSNTKKYQKEVYTAFYRYMREVAAGRRVNECTTVTLNHILQFVCGADEEPALAFFISLKSIDRKFIYITLQPKS